MKKLSVILISGLLICSASCKNKESGVCYCTYLTGDSKDYNLSKLPGEQQQDSCNVLNRYASAFAGGCKLD